MALGSKTLLALAATVLSAQTVETRHDHLWKTGAGTLTVSAEGIAWTERKEPKHDRRWTWQNIQRLELTPRRARLLTYEDAKWRAYRDREYLFEPLPEGFAASIASSLRERLAAKFVDAVPREAAAPQWQLPVKLLRRWGGSEGDLAFTLNQLVYRSPEHGESRSWPIEDIETVSSADRYELTVRTLEREYRFQLKLPITEVQYQALWEATQRRENIQ